MEKAIKIMLGAGYVVIATFLVVLLIPSDTALNVALIVAIVALIVELTCAVVILVKLRMGEV